MEKKSVGLTILYWSEIIISARVLLFSLPVLINKRSSGGFSLSDADDRLIIIISLAAVLYFVVGLMSIKGSKFLKSAHYSAVILVFLATVSVMRLSGQPCLSADVRYFSPFLFSVIVTVLAGILSKAGKRA